MSDPTARILVVDDEPGMREACRRVLSAEGYDVAVAEDGEAGLRAYLEGRDFAAGLIDLKMPGMDGLELIERLRGQDEDIVLFVITAYASLDTAVEATKRGAYGYIPKPFTPRELVLPVRQGLERRALAIEARRLRQEREHRLLEVAFERSQCNTIINCMTDGVLVANRDKQIVLRNDATGRIIPGCADLPLPASLRALPCRELRALITEALSSGSGPAIVSRETQLGDCTYMVNVSPVIESGGAPAGAVAVLRDITALKKLETAKSMFVSMVAHEVSAPLAAIEGCLNAVVSGAADEHGRRGREMLQSAVVRATTLRTMVAELLNLTAIETGRWGIKRVPLDIAAVVADTVGACAEKAQASGIELAFERDTQAPAKRALADRNAMTRVFANLIDNAVKYTPAPGHVRVGVQNLAMYVKVSVQDDGIGMTNEEKARAFDEFYRAKSERGDPVPGTGLGLSLVKRLVELHHGQIAVYSEPGKGSTFDVYVPTAERDG